MKTTLLLALHNHQPDGNFDEVFARAYDDCYRRILDALDEAPHVRCALHHTGALLEWFQQHHPEYLAQLRRLVARGQVEILGGGFYEPMLAVLPERDAVGQIEMMRRFCEQHLGASPRGMWLAERVWEPGLPLLLDSAGVKFTLIDDSHFRYAGVDGALRGYYATEKAGRAIAIFPIEQKLRYAIPFASPTETIATLRGLADEVGRDCVVTYGDDGEKFGVWPGTREWVWDKGWLRDFFRLLGEEQQRGTIETAHFSDVLATQPSSGRVYLPTASYAEMGEWALPAPAQRRYHTLHHDLDERKQMDLARPFLRGGIWQGFLARYPEANAMHKKMVQVSERVAAATAAYPERENENRQMISDLYRAQCNCSYWHGLFGGLYLNYLRDTVYRHLLVAEAFADAQLGAPAPAWAPNVDATATLTSRTVDVDGDLEAEEVVQTPALDVVVRPQEGASVAELAYRPKTFMLSNVLARHEEAYHDKLRAHAAAQAAAGAGGAGAGAGEQPKSIHDLVQVKEPGLEKHLVYDRQRRLLFVDRFLDPSATLEALAGGTAVELGDFAGARYQRSDGGEAPDWSGGVGFRRDGHVDGRAVRLQKSYRVHGTTLEARYRIEGAGGAAPREVLFAPEISLTLLDGHSQERTYRLPDRDLAADERVLASRGEWQNVPSLALINDVNKFRVDLAFGAARPRVWRYPLETVSMSEAGFERTYQGSVIVPLFPVRLDGGAAAEITVSISLSDI